ncbi:MAG: ribonuclease HI [Bacteroidota bacterium]|jgi:ribonuclease HI
MSNKIEIYTDGACSGNPGPGGYGVVMKFRGHRKEISQGYRLTTNNRMELLAVIVALESLKYLGTEVTVFSDSKYVVDAVRLGWLDNWIKKSFSKVKNPDLWIRFNRIFRQHNVNFVWVKGHADNEENNRCDELAVAASQETKLLVDEVFEEMRNSGLFDQ